MGGTDEKKEAPSTRRVPSTTMLYSLASTLVPGATVRVVPLPTVTLPVRTISPDHVVSAEIVLSAAGTSGERMTSKKSETTPHASRCRMVLR